MSGAQAFKRWDIVEFNYSTPTSDRRTESCRVHEESIRVVGSIRKPSERSNLLTPAIVSSEKEAIDKQQSLALILPKNIKFIAKKRTAERIREIKGAYEAASRQKSFLDKEIAELEPSSYDFKIRYDDESGPHEKSCGDWEVHAMYKKFNREYGSKVALEKMEHTFCVEYPAKGVMFALGNMAKRPQTWQLLGLIRVDISNQTSMDF